MRLYIKYMVSQRCQMLVKAELEKLGIHSATVDLGIVETSRDLTREKEALRVNLSASGLELLEDKKTSLVLKIKEVIMEMVYHPEEVPNVNFSEYLSSKLGQDYTYLSTIFIEAKGITIQEFIIRRKIERVKELLLDENLSLTDISYKLNYSSIAHLSNQFKKNTGFSPSCYRQMMSEKSEKGNCSEL